MIKVKVLIINDRVQAIHFIKVGSKGDIILVAGKVTRPINSSKIKVLEMDDRKIIKRYNR